MDYNIHDTTGPHQPGELCMEMSNDQQLKETRQDLTMDPAVGSAADKKRNKLGYHRTSVACVHCRKRKIRCLLASDDTRCENCIRLKKECHFFPVDQQPPMETKRSRSGSKTGATSTEASITSSPPALGGGGIVDQSDSYFQYAPMPMNSGQDISPFEPAPFATNPMPNFSPGPLSSHELTTVQPLNQPEAWDNASYFDQNFPSVMAKSQMTTPTTTLWNHAPTSVAPLSTDPSIPGTPITPGILPSTGDPTAFGMPDNSVWGTQPTRSATLAAGNLAQYQHPYQQPMPPEFKRRMTAPVDTYGHPANSSMSELQSSTVPVSYTQTQSSAAYASWDAYQRQPTVPVNLNQPVIGSTPDGLGGWYPADPQQYPVMKQEDYHNP
ncbi:C6 finger domain-containing protein [Histoplasma ohiense]|nr:C6 finger domain-containing protein [Histoplasma ohiense (nom. inval.)]